MRRNIFAPFLHGIMKRRAVPRGSLLFVLLAAFIVSILLYRSRFLFGLLWENGRRDAVVPSEFFSAASEKEWNVTAIIPKIIHQTYKTEEIPEHWMAGQKAVKELQPDWEYMFWTDDQAHTFISSHYPAFLPTYDSYHHPIQRADALRYFLLYHYGGIYLDLDLVPYRPFGPLLQFPAFACLTAPTGISNDILGSVPRHPFYKLLTENLEAYNRNWISGYITIMYSTGPLFFSALWVQYLWSLRENGDPMSRVRVLVPGAGYGDSYGFFKNVQGGSWHTRETEVIFWMGRHWGLVTMLGFAIGFSVTGMVWWLLKTVGKKFRDRGVYDKKGRYELWVEEGRYDY